MNVLNRSALRLKNNLPYLEIPELTNLGWVRHAFLTRQGGVSLPPYDSLNLSDKNGDLEKFVLQNTNFVSAAFGIESRHLILLDQMQPDHILILKKPIGHNIPQAKKQVKQNTQITLRRRALWYNRRAPKATSGV